MGFLSRKNKFKSAPVIEEPHPIVEELEEMEELVPERQDDFLPEGRDEETSERSATGPVAAEDRETLGRRVLSLQGTHHPLRSLKRPRGRYPLQRHPPERRLRLKLPRDRPQRLP